ncbi:tryptophan synthase, alpha subunit [Malaciobacter marinus]|uniref:Tryptophan synthase alpha chain n=1 Tax=Malaciobacter marinus TaxID=505249 RepID=A0A347TMV4_9BACT|nr:tryptophan synthase subunit alpha [Malaciobacter marinus]AXX87932.1 tryptophan synthase, alpha subunit [Malaciobacter marinus]PHO13234.1 tryptophan synthase subunit alpha [Malaciobacter marinus]PHO15987.1 tryptophan synthase subunit alpha [Malaciobacter marinus]
MKKLVGYITASYPDNNFTIDLALNMKESGVDILELGIPFSDPVADGPVIEKANLLALKNGFKLKDLFEVSSKIAPQMDTLWMGYLNPFYHYGIEEFFKKAKEFGITGEIIPDLPFEETFIYQELAKKYEQSIITFVSPTHSKERIAQVVKNATKFIYMVAYAGITGSGKSEDLTQVIKTVKENTKTPLYVGFGVDENTCKEKSVGVDGVIVGSAFVKHIIDDSLSYNEKIDKICKISKEIKEKING